jgi:hypothetical protein
VVNVLWGFLNLAFGFALLFEFAPKGADVVLEWVFVGLGALVHGPLLPGISDVCGRGFRGFYIPFPVMPAPVSSGFPLSRE